MKYIDPSQLHCCPNCGRQQKDANNLTWCYNPGRMQLYDHSTTEINTWLGSHHTHPDLHDLLRLYIQGCSSRQITYYCRPHSQLYQLALSQSEISWDNFFMGRIFKHIWNWQESYLCTQQTCLCATSWLKGFISSLHYLCHLQWIYQNITIHHHTNGTLKLKECKDVSREIKHQLSLWIGLLTNLGDAL